MDTRQDMANEIRAIREKLGMTLKEFGAKVGVTEATVSRWAAAKHIPDPEYHEKIAELRHKAGIHGGRFSERLKDLRERERLAPAWEVLEGREKVVQIGRHTVRLTRTGALVVNGVIRIDPGEEPQPL